MSAHLVRRAVDAALAVPAGPAVGEGFRRWPVVSEGSDAVHTGFAICELDPGGVVPPHVHSYEESLFMLAGTAVLDTAEGSYLLREGDYGVVPVGLPHRWRGTGETARWAQMQAPQPRGRYDDDTYPLTGAVAPLAPREPVTVDVRDPRTRSFGHITEANMHPDKQTQDLLAVSASMRTALLVYSGITVKMMVDGDLGASLSTMFMVRYEPYGAAGAHDHPFEETYLILDGEVDASFDGERYRLGPGDVAWTGTGCEHAFAAVGAPVRWLETQAPQPPARYSYRFARDWSYLRDLLREEAGS